MTKKAIAITEENQDLVPSTFDFAGVQIPNEYFDMVQMMAKAITTKIGAMVTSSRDYVESLESESQDLESQIQELKHALALKQARLSEVKKELAQFDAQDATIQRQVLRQLQQMGIVQGIPGPTRTAGRAQVSKAKFHIEYDGVIDGPNSYFESPGNLAWYKFGRCGSAKLYDVLSEQNGGIRPGSPEHEQLPGKRLAATLNGHVFAFIMD